MSVTRNYSQGSLLTQMLLQRLQTQGFPEADDMPVAVDLEVFGVSGLFVADNSVIPGSGASNPTLTTVTLAIRTADYTQQTSQ